MYFHFHCDDQGFDLLAGLFKRTAIEEMMHIEKLAERILFLKGDVAMKASGEVKSVSDVQEMLKLASAMEVASARDYNLWANECGNAADSVSKKLFEDLVADEERHFDRYDEGIHLVSPRRGLSSAPRLKPFSQANFLKEVKPRNRVFHI